jgi:hypothetical protein
VAGYGFLGQNPTNVTVLRDTKEAKGKRTFR